MDKDQEFKELEEKSIEYISEKWKIRGLPHYQDKNFIRLNVNDEIKALSTVNDIEKYLFQINQKRILDIGCGLGGLVTAFRLKGAEAIGFDIDADAIEICKLRAKYYGFNENCFFVGNAESIPFPDKFFDLITASSVLEHVGNLEKVIEEISRVSKAAYIVFPNPLCPREAHYKIFWIPYMPKMLGKLYLKIRSFNPEFFEKHVHYVSIRKITKLLEENRMKVENITEKKILEKLNNPSQIEFSISHHYGFKKFIETIRKLGLSKLIAKGYALFGPSIIVIARDKTLQEVRE